MVKGCVRYFMKKIAFVCFGFCLLFPLSWCTALPLTRVCIDPGHGGVDTGITGAGPLYEKNITVQLASRIKEQLAGYPGFDVVLTRFNDLYLTEKERQKRIVNCQPSLVLSLHCDAAWDTSVSGISLIAIQRLVDPLLTIERRQAQASAAAQAAEIMYEAMARQVTLLPLRRPVIGDLCLYRSLNCPVVMVAAGFLTNPEDALLLSKPETLDEISRSIAQALIELTENGEASE